MNALPWPARIYVGGLVLAAAATAIVFLIAGGQPESLRALGAAGCAGLIALAWLRPFPLSFKRKLFLDTSVLIFVTILFEPGMAMLIASVGTIAAHLVRNHDWVEGAFNASQMALQAAVGSLILTAGGFDHTLDEMNSPLTVALIVVAGASMYLVNSALVATMVAAQSAMSVTTVMKRGVLEADPSEHLFYFAQVGLGAAGAVFVLAAPWMIPLLCFPVVAIYSTMARNVHLRWRAEMALRDRDADLAEAQRIARIGSWQWDLKTGNQSWSDETYRLLGVDRETVPSSFEALKSSVHPDDRSLFDRAVHATLYSEAPFSIEHRICSPSGEELTVHQRGEVIFDEDGTKIRLAGTIQDITERKLLEKQIEDLAERDRIAAELAEGRRRLATSRELERLRLARELHDGPVQDLLAISYSLAAQRRTLGNGHDTIVVADINEEIRQDILGVVAQLRELVGELRPPGLAEFGLKAALEGYVAELGRRDGIETPAIFIDFEDMPELPQPLAMTTFRIVQEALRNAIRHSSANEVTIHLRQESDQLKLEIFDDGQGFSLPDRMNELADRGHFGLIGLVERVDQAKGRIDIASEPGNGTAIAVTLPVTNLREQHAGHDSGRARG
jgi:PAS domain S-box-containing protein